MKAIVELEHRMVLPNIKYKTPSPNSMYCISGHIMPMLNQLQFTGKKHISQFQPSRRNGQRTGWNESASTAMELEEPMFT